jgi:CRISPR type III-A-associated RAMP protein Csm5
MELKLEVRSPLHVGSGDDLTYEERLFEDGTVYVPDVTDYFRDHRDEIDAFVDGVGEGKPPSIFFENIRQYSRYAIESWATKHTVGRSPIKTIMKNAADEPYLPGSSIKGAIRTALAHHALAGDGLDDLREEAVQRLFRPEQNNPKGDLLKCVTVRDSEPIDHDALVLGEVKTYSLSRAGEMRAKEWSNFAELLRPGTQITTEISVDDTLLNRMIDSQSARKQAEAVLGEGLTEQSVLERIAEALKAFEQATVEEERTLTGDFDDIETFYGECEDSTPRLRLGFGTSYYSNTVASALSDAERISIQMDNGLGRGPFHDDCGESLSRDRHNSGKLFCHQCMTGNLDPQSDKVVLRFPKTRRLVLHDGTPEYPLGWVDITNRSF